jgi:hypothetical protein
MLAYFRFKSTINIAARKPRAAINPYQRIVKKPFSSKKIGCIRLPEKKRVSI